MPELLLLLAADIILFIHVLFVAFVVFSLFFIYIGFFLNWQWIRHFWFRTVHLICIGIVVLQSWFGLICPLTIWEMALREIAGDATYAGSFIQYWLQYILYYDAPDWVFMLIYTVFGGLILASWFIVKPDKRPSK